MELKSTSHKDRLRPKTRSNRTFMELKSESDGWAQISSVVLIVPLWN